MRYKRFAREDCYCVEKAELESVKLYLTCYPNMPVFVISPGGRVQGVISTTNLKEYEQKGQINTAFKSLELSDGYREKVESFFENTTYAWIPVVAPSGELVECWTRWDDSYTRYQREYVRGFDAASPNYAEYVQQKGYRKLGICINGEFSERLFDYFSRQSDRFLAVRRIENMEEVRSCDLLITTEKVLLSREDMMIYSIREIQLIVEYMKLLKHCLDSGVRLYMVTVPYSDNTNLTEEQRKRTREREEKKKTWHKYIQSKELYSDLIREVLGEDKEFIDACLDLPSVIAKNNLCYIHDYVGKYCTAIGGNRVTVGSPVGHTNTLWLSGGCYVFGPMVDDAHTLASQLQQAMLSSEEYQGYQVVNEGIRGVSPLASWQRLLADDFRKNDVVIYFCWMEQIKSILQPAVFEEFFGEGGYYICRLEDAINEKAASLGNYFLDAPIHPNAAGYSLAVSYLMRMLQEKDCSWMKEQRMNLSFAESSPEDPELMKYISEVKKQVILREGKRGAIVMNANPFTYGHRHLIAYAAEQVDQLLVFVVEEDKSYFAFEDRLQMISRGVEDYENVTVIPSGKYIISTLTFPDYFTKQDAKMDTVVDTSEDVTLFGKYICRELGITVRFAGEEPTDIVTAQYNITMKKLLPMYGVEFVEIPRASLGGEVISATEVRSAMKRGDWDRVRMFVPKSTYYVLQEKYKE